MERPGTFLISLIVKKKPFLYTPFWTYFIVKKRHHRNKHLGLLILNLYLTSKRLYTQHQNAYTRNTKHFLLFLLSKPKRNKQKKSSQFYMIPNTIINQKGTSNKFAPEIFNSYDPFYYNKQKGTNNKYAPEIF